MKDSVTMGLHFGNALKLLSDNYPLISKVILELIQNSLDSDATEIQVSVDYSKRIIYVRDNGVGISPEKFREAVSRVCSSMKSTDKLGQFGIGLFSPLGKCKTFTVTSAPMNAKYNCWTFDSEAILRNSQSSEIPCQAAPDILYSLTGRARPGLRSVNWRTEVRLQSFTKDSSISAVTFGDLRSLILGQFSEAMKRLRTSILLRIKKADGTKEEMIFQANQFKGEKLDPVVYGDEKVGQTSFEIFISPKTKTGRQGQIIFGIRGNDFRIPMSIFKKSLAGFANQETIDTLSSGFFEGQIVSDRCSLHQNRKEFREDDAMMNFCIHLDSWVTNHGQRYILQSKDASRDEKLQAIGQIAIKDLEEKIKKEMPQLMSVVKSFKIGNIGPGHNGFDFAGKEQGFRTKEANIPGGGGQTAPEAKKQSPREADHPGHTPFSVSGPKGSRRRLVRGHSTGLQFCYEEMPGNDNHWEFEAETGILTFNIRSELWAKMEISDRNLILYQEYVAIKALEMCLEPAVNRPTIFDFLQRELRTAVIFINGSITLQPRKAKAEIGKRLN